MNIMTKRCRATLTSRASGLEKQLQRLLDRISELTGFGGDLRVVYRPNGESGVLGEVRGNLIYIYAADEREARYALIHEYAEWLLSQYLAACLTAREGLLTRHFQAQKELIVDAIASLIEKLLKLTLTHRERQG